MGNQRAVSQYEKMTQTPIPRLIVSLSIPTILSMLVTSIYNMVDTAFVGRLGNSASGAVGIVFGYMAILQAVGFMFGQGSGSIIARKQGAGDYEKATIIASTGFFLTFLSGIVIGLVSFLTLDPLVMLLGSTETIAPFARDYIGYLLVAAPFLMSSLVLNNILRYEGKAALGMIGLMTGSILNIIGDPIFMFYMKMGVKGAGLSTALAQFVSFCILLSMFLRGKTQCRLAISKVSFNFFEILDIAETGLPSLLRQGLSSVSTILLNNAAGLYGDAAVAAISIVNRIVMFVFSMVIGVGQGFQPVSGFNYGAGKYKRVRQAYKVTFIISEVMLGLLLIVVLLKAGSLIGLFRDDSEVILLGTRALILQCIATIFMPICAVTEMLMQTTGNKFLASLLSSLRSGIFLIPAILILPKIRGFAGIQEAQPIAFVFSGIVAFFVAVRFFKAFPTEDKI